MMIHVCRAKIHRARITEANLEYEGSISIDKNLLRASGIKLYEKVQVVNVNNGARFETYVIEGEDGEICLNGPAARLGQVDDLIIIIAYALVDEKEADQLSPVMLMVDKDNKPKT